MLPVLLLILQKKTSCESKICYSIYALVCTVLLDNNNFVKRCNRVCVCVVAPHVLGPGAARWGGAAGADPQEATFQRNGGQPHHAEAGVGRQSHARRRSGSQGPEA